MSFLTEARKRLKLTQQSLADLLGCPQSQIAEWESRRRPVPQDRVVPLSRALGLDPEAIELYSGKLPDAYRELDPRRVLHRLRRLRAITVIPDRP